MSQGLYIPTFIADANFKPARVQPRLFFYNGKKNVTTPWKFHEQNDSSGDTFYVNTENSFPYVDHYTTGSSGEPDADSQSLLFFNEPPGYGTIPSNNLYTEYWDNYVQFLFSPQTRFVECEAFIPFGRYVGMKLNDVVIYKGKYYHLRAINDYDLSNGNCKLQLLGPIIRDTLDNQ